MVNPAALRGARDAEKIYSAHASTKHHIALKPVVRVTIMVQGVSGCKWPLIFSPGATWPELLGKIARKLGLASTEQIEAVLRKNGLGTVDEPGQVRRLEPV